MSKNKYTDEQARAHERKVKNLDRRLIASRLTRADLPPYEFPETWLKSPSEAAQIVAKAKTRKKRRLKKSPLSDRDRIKAANTKKAEARIVTALVPVVAKVKDFLRSEDRSTKATNIQSELFANAATFGLDVAKFGLTRYRIRGRRFLEKIRQASKQVAAQ